MQSALLIMSDDRAVTAYTNLNSMLDLLGHWRVVILVAHLLDLPRRDRFFCIASGEQFLRSFVGTRSYSWTWDGWLIRRRDLVPGQQMFLSGFSEFYELSSNDISELGHSDRTEQPEAQSESSLPSDATTLEWGHVDMDED